MDHFRPKFHSWVWSSQEGGTTFEGDGRRGREEVVSYAACFGSLYCAMIDTKMVAWQMREEKEMHND